MCRYKSTSFSIGNSKGINKPNEDYYVCDDNRGIYILLDGVSRDKIDGKYPNPSPSAEVSKLFAEIVYSNLISNSYDVQDDTVKNKIFEAVRLGNEAVNVSNAKKTWENNFLPGTVGVVVWICGNCVHYAYIGDCFGLIVGENNKYIFTECQTKLISCHKKEYSAYQIRNEICNNADHPYSYGVWNGDKRAMDFVRYGEKICTYDEKVLLCSDGFSGIIEGCSASELFVLSEQFLNKMYQNGDDKTMIIVEIEHDEKDS